MLDGSINHVSLTVSDLDEALVFYRPLLELLGYEPGEPSVYQGHRLVVAIHPRNGTALNLWEAEPELAGDRFAVYAPGLHHVCWNVAAASRVDAVAALVGDLGYEVLDGPGEFPFAEGGYYAVYFRGPDGLKLEVVFMPELAGSLSGR